MASITLAMAQNLTQNEMIAGVIESTITVDQFYDVLPFMPIGSNAISYNRELVLGDVQVATVGDTITAKAAATVTPVTSSLTKIIGDAEVDDFVQLTMSGMTDQTGYQIASKAKSAGRKYRDMLVNGDSSTPNEFDGLLALVDAGKTIGADATDGDVLSFEKLDAVIDLVTDKDGQVDYLIMNQRERRALMALYRSVGGATPEYIETARGRIMSYAGIPVFADNWTPINQLQGGSTNAGVIIAGTLDDGSHKVGISGLSSAQDFGLSVKSVGTSQTKDEEIYRVRWYCGMALWNLNGLAVATGIIPAT